MLIALSYLISFAPSPDQQRRSERQSVALEIAKEYGGSSYKEGDNLATDRVAYQFWAGPEHDHVGAFELPSQVEAMELQDELAKRYGQAAGQRIHL